MADLVEFLHARFDDDQELARLAGGGEWHSVRPMSGLTLVELDVVRAADDEVAFSVHRDSAVHMAHWDPARVLAEIEAKRDVLRHHAQTPAKKHPGFDCAWCGMHYPCFDAQALARPYVGHPDFRPAWAASGLV